MNTWNLPLIPPYPVMEARTVDHLPRGPQWQYEPKWDGFRCLAFKDGRHVELQAKSGKFLTRFFPDIVEGVEALPVPSLVIDSELVIPVEDELSFEELQLRLHPAGSRVSRLALSHPAVMVAFDLLVDEKGELLTRQFLEERRSRLEDFMAKWAPSSRGRMQLSPATRDTAEACQWFGRVGPGFDGIVAKRLDMEYRSGDRTGMAKYKNIRSVDCVVGGFRYRQGEKTVGSLLLGLYDQKGLLHHVGFTTNFPTDEKDRFTAKLEGLRQEPGFTGRAPGGRSRWATERSGEWEPLKPELVIEVTYDHFTGGRFRHATGFVRWRPDKDPTQCTFDQLRKNPSEGKGLTY